MQISLCFGTEITKDFFAAKETIRYGFEGKVHEARECFVAVVAVGVYWFYV